MEMKEFYYQDGLRVSVFNLDHEAVPYHFHNEVSDMVYCSLGQISIELPEAGEVFTVLPGEVFQVPRTNKHRFVNGAPVGTPSRYVLLQIGTFDINFVPPAEGLAGKIADSTVTHVADADVYVEDRKAEIIKLADHFASEKPEVLTTDEQADVVRALRCFVDRGIPAEHPRAAARP
ncbi:cupin domain-containing protein [Streptomyces sp. CWNU-52B]|uniref:cupin domain-containing protein n=1 Tax=unclassified Streptomyces TaxID=2593676 RepID=UPI0039BF2A70